MEKTTAAKLNKLTTRKNTKWVSKAKERYDDIEAPDYSLDIGISILRAIKSKGISQSKLAEIMGVTAPMINKVIKGKENLTVGAIKKYEKALDISLITVTQFDGDSKGLKEWLLISKIIELNSTITALNKKAKKQDEKIKEFENAKHLEYLIKVSGDYRNIPHIKYAQA